MRHILIALMACSLVGPAAAQVLQTFTQAQNGNNLRPLGYPVPLPVDSLTPIDGFRSYASLHARLQSLALESLDLSAHAVGSTHSGRDVFAYVASSPSPVDREGRSKPAFFINATTHAREWGVPEISTGLIERLIEQADSDGMARYLLDNTRLVVVPVQNVDGFLQTQRFPTEVLVGQDPRVPSDWPRDGRMRRKNMQFVDDLLTSTNDHLFGVDLNRNHPPFWGTTTSGGELTNIRDLTYRGTVAQSEPEVMAMLAAADLAPVSRLRLGIDLHSHQRLFYSANTGRSRLNATQADLIARLRSHHFAVPTAAGVANARTYTNVPDPANVGIGTHAEYFAYQWLVPAWTLEIEPGAIGGREYGGTAESHAGFILPASEVRRVREAWAESHLVAFYYMAGAPMLSAVELSDPQTAQSRWRSEWRIPAPGAANREQSLTRDGPLFAGESVSATFEFNKPMRLLSDGQVRGLPGISIDLLPQIWRVSSDSVIALDASAGQWIPSSIYPGMSSAFRIEFDVPANGGEFGLEVDTTDLVGHRLDANPASPVDWSSGAWSGWNSNVSPASEGDTGGIDRTTRLTASATPPGQVPRLLNSLPSVIGEGDLISARFFLDEPASDRIEILAEDPEVTRLRPTISPVPPPAESVVWLAGERGERLLEFFSGEDAEVSADVERRLAFGLQIGNELFDFIDVGVTHLDNDRLNLPVINATAPTLNCCAFYDLERALGLSAEAGQTVEVIARSDHELTMPTAAGRIVPISVAGSAKVFGNGARVVTGVGTRAGTLFDVLPGGQLVLDQLEFLAGPSLLTVLQPGETPQPMLQNAGEMSVERAIISSKNSQFSNVFSGSGQTRVSRSWFRPSLGIPLAETSGSLTLASSTAPGVRSDTGLLRVAGDTRGDWLTFYGITATESHFSTLGSGTLRWTGSVFSELFGGAGFATCQGNVTSGGFNVGYGSKLADCIGSGESDQLLPQGPSIGTPPPGTFDGPWRLPATRDTGGNCPQVDQRGAPRPQAATPEAVPLCDAGSIEFGVNPYRGIWQPERSGHGVDLQTSGNQLLLAWYTYDDDGQPTAYQAAAPLTGSRWDATLLRSSRDPETGMVNPPTRVGTVAIDFASDTRATLRWRFDSKGIDGSETIEASLFDPATPAVEVTGLWFPPAESGYGATITRRGATTAIGMYYYDASGALRWALGTGGGESADDIAMTSYTGFCPDCNHMLRPLAAYPAGRVLYHFLTPRRARIDTDLSYPGPAGGRWFRERADFVPLNDPVDNREVISAHQP